MTEKILEKYKDNARNKNDQLLPISSNQRTNAFLKEIALIRKIIMNLTFHFARHTIATAVIMANGFPIESVRKMLGHQSLKTTQVYATMIDRKLKLDMNTIGKIFTPDFFVPINVRFRQ